MTKEEALEILSDGHTVISVEKAKEVCDTVGVSFVPESIVRKFKSGGEGKYHLTMNEGCENTEGVYTLYLSSYVARKFGVQDKAGNFYGRGSQARAYAKEIKKVLNDPLRATIPMPIVKVNDIREHSTTNQPE